MEKGSNAIFIYNFLLTFIEAWLFLYLGKSRRNEKVNKRNKKIFIFLVCLQWVLISGLRADIVGSDTLNYMRTFDLHSKMRWSDLKDSFKTFWSGDSEYGEFEPGFLLFEWILHLFNVSHLQYKFIVAIIFMTSLGMFVYRYCDEPFLAFMLYDGMFYNMFSLTGYRQVISVSIGILCSFKYLMERKPIPFFILVFIAAFIHKTTLVFAPFYFISNIKFEKKYKRYLFMAVVVILGMIMLRNELFNYVKGIVGYDVYGKEQGLSQRNFLMMFTGIFALCLWRYRRVTLMHNDANVYYLGLIMSAMMVPFAMVSASSMRLVYDFLFQLMLLLPYVWESMPDEKDKKIMYTAVFVIFMYFIVMKTPPYKFYWQARSYF